MITLAVAAILGCEHRNMKAELDLQKKRTSDDTEAKESSK